MHVRWSDQDKELSSSKQLKRHVNAKEIDVKAQQTSEKSTSSDLFQALFPIYHLSKVCGLLPVRFVEKAPGKYEGRLNVFDIVYSAFLLALIVSAEIWGLWRDLKDGWEYSTRLKSQTAVIITLGDVVGVMSLTCVSVLGSPFRWKYIQVVLDKLVEIDEKLGIVSPKKTRKLAILLVVFNLSFLLTISILDIYIWDLESKASKKRDDKGPINYTPLYFMYAVIVIMECQYSLITYNLGQRFVRLNKILEDILKSDKITDHFRKDLGLASDFEDHGQFTAYIRSDPGNNRMVRKSKIIDWYPTTLETRNLEGREILQLITVHSTLCDAVTFINNAYGIAMLVVTLTCLLHLIVTPYFLITETNRTRAWLFLVVQGLWCILHLNRMLIIVQPAYHATIEVKKTAILVSQLLSANADDNCKKYLEIFSLQLLHRSLEFTACGLFSLDRTLITSIAGAVTTYLVILIQFQKADESSGDLDNKIKNATQNVVKNVSSLYNLTVLKLNP